ncbi:hypothetical protein [Blastochloris viridis]|uniref:Uncharacterized protein n=1 Tax=Blastochloris viridis TaxID=1079 RepID=A0A0H5BDX2_BLAVI|nr:hypothetical protein [Blastochloris viridis]ALK08183.1 hypothetical protein BVIR_385 [Blastochloris viridis]BAR98551.1 hypothetical protein BV133_958 [Blastochloris viridis]CUU44105.1 hypothetical protein BVIRIDIS_31520 [Blastochloris viridis]
MAEPDNLVLSLLRDLRSRMEARFDKVDAKLAEHDLKFETIEKKIEGVKQAAFGESVLGRYAAAEVEERLAEIERRLQALETRS